MPDRCLKWILRTLNTNFRIRVNQLHYKSCSQKPCKSALSPLDPDAEITVCYPLNNYYSYGGRSQKSYESALDIYTEIIVYLTLVTRNYSENLADNPL